ncbi:MAG TPA: PilN domain-containing protein [Thermoanaerobaculaceae bacterium]|nr:PilN domain-containing protein [Thermoanaerobaculaceae bacterium]
MIKINLLVEARAEKVARAPLISLGAAKLNNYVLLGLIVLALAFVGLRYWKLTSTLASIKAEIATNQREFERLKPIIAEVENFKKKNAELKHKIEVIEQLKQNQYGPVRVMDEVSKALPDLTWLTTMSLNGNTLNLQGQALNENAVANFISNLTASPFFAEPSLKIMSQDEKGVFTFDLSCTFTQTPREAAPAAAARS